MDKKFFIAILSHSKSIHRETQKTLLFETNRDRFIIYYFIGDPTLECEYKVDAENNIVYLNVPDNYESLPYKTYGAIKFAYDNFSDQIHGVLKTDDDIALDLDKVHTYLEENKDTAYCGIATVISDPHNLSRWHMGKCESPILNATPQRIPLTVYCAGGGYYLNLSSMQKFVWSKDLLNGMIFEDAATGYVLNSNGIFPKSINLMEHGFYWEGISPPRNYQVVASSQSNTEGPLGLK